MQNPNFELRQLHDGTWSVVARVFDPSKEFYEHPNHIHLTEDQAKERCDEIIQENPSLSEIKKNWVLIGS